MQINEYISKSNFSRSEILELLKENSREVISAKFKKLQSEIPSEIKRYETILNFSNYCKANCEFCKFRNGNNSITRYKLNREEIIEKGIEIYENGSKSILLHSGYDSYYNTDRISYIIYSLKQKTKLKIGLSFGLREFDEYRKWKIAGADSYYLNLITSNLSLYEESQAFGSLDERIFHLKELKDIGYSVGSGTILNIVGEKFSDLSDDIIQLKKLDIKHIHFCNANDFSAGDSITELDFSKRGLEVAQLVFPHKNIGIYNFGISN